MNPSIIRLDVLLLFAAPVSALLLGFFVVRPLRPEKMHWPVLASCLLITVAAESLLWNASHGGAWDVSLFRWMAIGDFAVDFGVRVDGLNASILGMVAIVGTLIHFYAAGYMKGDPGFSRFFLYFHFFFLSMIGLLLSNSYLQMYLFWECVGLSSYLLIGFWYDRPTARAAAWKAFLTNRIGDVGFLAAILLILSSVGSTRFEDFFSYLPTLSKQNAIMIAGLLFWAACAKSAQFPLYVWLPDAMEGPTPVSALMHAATMVTAGVFLMARSWPLIERAPEIQALIAAVGAVTSLGAAGLASIQKDLKRILAYSTVSHLGLMMLSLGVGSVFGAVFHLIAHGFFKAALFLCAGNILHGIGSHGTAPSGIYALGAAGKDVPPLPAATVDDVGQLSVQMRGTFVCFLVAGLALAGFPPFSGFFSKDSIIAGALEGGSGALKSAIILISAGSSLYIFRMLFLSFFGNRPEQKKPHVHDPGLSMLAPVYLLAAGSALIGIIGWNGSLQRIATPSGEGFHFEWTVAAFGFIPALAGLLGAYACTMASPSWDWKWRRSAPRLERWLNSDLGWQTLAFNVAADISALSQIIATKWEKNIWDPWTESVAECVLGLGEGLSGISRGLVNDYLWWMAAGTTAVISIIAASFWH